MAGGADDQADAPLGATAPADAAGAGQPGRTQDARVRLLAVRARGHAAVYAGGRLVAEHGREHPADPEAPGIGWSASDEGGADHGVVRGRRDALECGADAVPVEWPSRGPSSS